MPLRFTRKFIDAETFEAVAVFDVDSDGILDIVTPGFWYKGPDFRKKIPIALDLKRHADYYDEFSVLPLDIDGDGYLDFVTGGYWGNNLRWRRNPAKPSNIWKPEIWTPHILADAIGNVETTRAWDIDNDGELEIVPNTPNHPQCAYKLLRDSAGKPTGQFAKHLLYPEKLGHGLGFGDIDGDGRGEIISAKGILKAPAAGPFSGPWTFTEEFNAGPDASIPMLVADVNGDGIMDLIVGGAHSYGLFWLEQKRDSAGKRSWLRHDIDTANSQYHDLHWADIDNDGKPELITGKRYMAHCGNDPGEFDDLGIYYFKWTGESFAKQVIAYGPPGIGKGCGIAFALADLRKTGRLDVIAPGKDGLVVFFNEGSQ